MHYPLLNLLADMNPMEHVYSHPLNFRLFGFPMTNQTLMALVAAILMLIIFPVLFRKAQSDAPSGAKNFFESILEFLRVEVFRPALKEHTERFLPFLWTMFFFILFCNLLGQIPIGEIITLFTRQPSHIGGTATGTLTTTAALAICALFCIQVSGVLQVYRSLRDGT